MDYRVFDKKNRITLTTFVLFIFILIFLVFSPYQYGDPVDGERIVLRQPDGTEIVGIVFGDEFHHRIETEDGYTIILNEQTGKIEYAHLKQRKLVPSGMVVGTVSPAYLKKIHFPKHLSDRVYRVAEHRLIYPEKFHDVNSWERKRSTQTRVQALTGTLKVFVICVEFQPEGTPPTKWYQGVYAPGNFNTRLFSTNPADISMANYYKANSYDQFYPVGYTYPNWVTLPQTASWYKDSSSWRQMIRDAMDKIKNEDPSFDFSLYANNGNIDITVIWAGSRQTWSDFYWPHMSGGGFSRHGVTVRTYNAVNERNLNGTENTGIGTFCHEYGHVTGSPDLYDYSSFNKVVGYYGIMAWSNPGTNFCGYLKWKEYGWITPTLITSGGQYSTDALGLATVSNPRLYQIMIDNPKEYLLIENRYNGADPNYENYSNRWSGLFITHVDENYPPARGQPAHLFYGLEAIVPGLDTTITELLFYTIHFKWMVFSADQGYTRLDPYYPDFRPPGSYLILSHDDGIEHVIFRNTQGHTKSTDIWIIDISNAGSTMSFSVNVQMYWISGNVYIPSVQGEMESASVSKRRRSFMHRSGGKLSTDRINTLRSRAKSKRTKLTKLARKVDQGISGVEMNGFSGNPITDSSGDFTALVGEGWTGVVTPSKEHYSFNPSNRTYTNVSSDLDNQDFEALRNIYAPKSFFAIMELNRSLSQAEYINVLGWYYNSDNENIVSYRIYLIEGQNRTLLFELDGNTTNYWHRNVNKDTHYKYAICAVNNEGREGESAYAEINLPK